MDGVILHEKLRAKHPTMIIAFAGWPDAAEAATRAVRYLVRKLPAQKIAEIDCEDYYDFTLTRPQSRMNKKKERIIKWPTNEFYSYIPENDPDNGILLYVGTEPNLKWKTFSKTIMQVANSAGVELILCLGALLDAVPHTRQIKITGRSSNPELNQKAQWFGIKNSAYQGPTGIHSAFAQLCDDQNMPHATLWSHCPHYVQSSPNPVASHALLQRLKSFVDLDIDFNELSLAGKAFSEEISKAIDKQPDVKSYVSNLEAQFDQTPDPDTEIPAGHDMVSEIENFLKSQSSGSDPS
jgi:proteasome assembly chaperone (PAC2) family protein